MAGTKAFLALLLLFQLGFAGIGIVVAFIQMVPESNSTIIINNLQTGSMGGGFDREHLDFVLNDTYPYTELGAGDIICYRISPGKLANLSKIASPLAQGYVELYQDGRLLCHRVVVWYDGKLVVKGDENRLPDPYFVEINEYYGKVV